MKRNWEKEDGREVCDGINGPVPIFCCHGNLSVSMLPNIDRFGTRINHLCLFLGAERVRVVFDAPHPSLMVISNSLFFLAKCQGFSEERLYEEGLHRHFLIFAICFVLEFLSSFRWVLCAIVLLITFFNVGTVVVRFQEFFFLFKKKKERKENCWAWGCLLFKLTKDLEFYDVFIFLIYRN